MKVWWKGFCPGCFFCHNNIVLLKHEAFSNECSMLNLCFFEVKELANVQGLSYLSALLDPIPGQSFPSCNPACIKMKQTNFLSCQLIVSKTEPHSDILEVSRHDFYL